MPSSGGQTCARSEEHTSELQSHDNLVCRLLLEKTNKEYPESLHRLSPRVLVDRQDRRSLYPPSHGRAATPPPGRRPPPSSWDRCFFFNVPGPPEISPLPLQDALPI